MDLKEYYPTRCELEILKNSAQEVVSPFIESPFRLLELGAGDGRKTARLLKYFLEWGLEFIYVPIDICEEAVAGLVEFLKRSFTDSALRVRGVVAEYFDALAWLSTEEGMRHAGNGMKNLVLFLGSNIGNFDDVGARRFLRHLWYYLNHNDYALIGFDLKKDISILEPAYNDARGVTREFNLNLLERINRELGADFDRTKFVHYSRYNVARGRMESWLVSMEAQTVSIPALEKTFQFGVGEGIHVENSYKYSTGEIEQLAAATGFVAENSFFDSRRYFTDSLWRVKKVRRL